MSAEINPQDKIIDTWIRIAKSLGDVSQAESLVKTLVDSKVNLVYAMSRAQAAASIYEDPEQLPQGLYKVIQLLGVEDGSGTGLSVWQEYFAMLREKEATIIYLKK